MNKFFIRLPLLVKLMLIGLIPFGFFVYLTISIYNEKTRRLKLFDNYKTFLEESANINRLIESLQDERKYSFDYAMMKTMRKELVLQRPKTDSLLQKLLNNGDPALQGLTQFTRLGELASIRGRIDSFKIGPNDVMHYYSNTVFRMNTLNTIPPGNTPYLQPVYNDLMVQKILSEMITYLGIIRSNIYNVLHTRLYMLETLVGTVGAHDVYQSYEKELLTKAAPKLKEEYLDVKTLTAVKPTTMYIDTLFKRFQFDSSYTAADWWKVSDAGVDELRKFQDKIWVNINSKISELYDNEKALRQQSLVWLIVALALVIAILTYIVFIISQSLGRLRFAAEKIANGETSVSIEKESNDAVGSLADSILKIGTNQKALASAAHEIGKGNFDVNVYPRSNGDVLGNAIVQMKSELEQYSKKMEELVAQRTEQLARSNEDLQQFAHVASHDLKEPLRKITTFSNLLSNEQKDVLSDRGKVYLAKIEKASIRMSKMIEGVLAYSIVSTNEEVFDRVDLNKIVEEVENDLELTIVQKDAKVSYDNLHPVSGMRLLIYQLFYNLISNALKFTKEGVPPVINIRTTVLNKPFNIAGLEKGQFDKFVRITIEDNGIGFDQEYAEQLFNVFSRLNSKDKYEGTGLGLALCKKIVRRHGGELYAEGKEGEGATFHIILPAR